MPIRGTFGILRVSVLVLAVLAAQSAAADEWTHWRGPHQDGVSDATGLISTWSKDGDNLIWRANFTGRSTPVVFDGRVCASGREGEGIDRQEVAACWNAETGARLWQRNWNVFNTGVPWTRVSWGSPAADSETGFLYVQGVSGYFVALDRDGDVAWEWELGDDLGRFSGYGGRTNSPIVDEDRVIVHSISSVWGPHRPGGDRYVAFDKQTGEILWMTNRNGPPAGDVNTYATPVVAEIGGRRQLITGGADGWVWALDARTGQEIWKFRLSQRGLNSSPVVDGNAVYVSHSEENVDTGVMGRLVAIDATGGGDVTKSHEKWRVEGLQAGYASPTIHDGVLYAADNSANVVAYDAATGAELWHYNYGTVGKGSPVWADGKLYLTEVNGNVVIAEVSREGARQLDAEHIEVPDGSRYAEIFGSIAVAYGRLYFTTEEGVYCLGDKSKPFSTGPAPKPAMAAKAPAGAAAAHAQIVPAIYVGKAGDKVEFRVRTFDDKGRRIAETTDAAFTLAGLPGRIGGDGVLTLGEVQATQVGTVTAKIGELSSVSMLRVGGALPWSEDFESYEVGMAPAAWLGVGKGATVQELDGGKVLAQPQASRGAPRATILIGPAYLRDYTIQADVRGTKDGRRLSDVGLLNSGYTVEIMGAHQRIQVSSWTAERRMAQFFDFDWELGVWYTMKVRVDSEGEGEADKAVIRGKIWRRGEDEPADWTVTVEDPHPIRNGAPGLYTFAPTDFTYFDNVRVTSSK